MSKFKFYYLYFLFFSLSYGQNSNFEFSGIEQFWKIVKIFEANMEPNHRDWEKLFSTPGYKILVNGEFTREFFIDNFRLVFKPNARKELEKKLQRGENLSHLNHYIKIRDNRNLINEQLRKLKTESYSRKAVKNTLEYLPQYSVSQMPPVSFVIFESNGRGSSPIVVDLAATIEWDFMSFLSHEYHHWYRNRQLQLRIDRLNSQERNLLNTLSLIEAEGIADMVDKKEWYTKPSNAVSEYARRYLRDVGRTPYVIKSIDRLLSNTENNKNLANSILRHLPQRGHTTGYYMARVILERENKKKLVDCVGNPIEFILIYNDAAKKSNGKYPTFSRESIQYLNKIYSKCSN